MRFIVAGLTVEVSQYVYTNMDVAAAVHNITCICICSIQILKGEDSPYVEKTLTTTLYGGHVLDDASDDMHWYAKKYIF